MGSRPNFARCWAFSCAGAVYIHFWGTCPLTEFCQAQSSLCAQVLRSPILAVLLLGTRAVGISQTLRCGTRNGITKLSQTAPPIWQGGHLVGHRLTFLAFFKITFVYLFIHCVRKKSYIFAFIFTRCSPIFKSRSPKDLATNFWQSDNKIWHHILNASLHYYVKY